MVGRLQNIRQYLKYSVLGRACSCACRLSATEILLDDVYTDNHWPVPTVEAVRVILVVLVVVQSKQTLVFSEVQFISATLD